MFSTRITQASWEEKYFNPVPSKDDVILPMPCEGMMVFRKIHVPLNNPLDDYPINIGQDDAEFGYVEHSRPVHIAGSFSEDKQKSRYYLLAKYEMTELQYQTLTQEQCPKAANRLRQPITNISWIDAMRAADIYNLWLRKNAADKLPKEDGVPGFLRLPTEVEWEFAARGGLQVQPVEYRDLHYPMPDGINAYEWFAGTQSANGKLQLTGLLKPNPLGLHDVLGNADEMIFEPFRLNRLDRDHGQAGGYIVRGGNFLTTQSDLRSALRKERSYYEGAGAHISKTTGFRLALVSTTLTSRGRVAKIETSWKNLGANEVISENKVSGTPVQTLKILSSEVEDKKLKEKLKTLENQLRASNQKQEEARDLAIRANLNLGAFLCTKLLDDGEYLDFLNRNYEINCKNADADVSCPGRKVKLDEQIDRLQKLGLYYGSNLVEASSLYGEKLLAHQIPVLEDVLSRNPQLRELVPYLKTHWHNQKTYISTGKIDVGTWLKGCKAVKKSRKM